MIQKTRRSTPALWLLNKLRPPLGSTTQTRPLMRGRFHLPFSYRRFLGVGLMPGLMLVSYAMVALGGLLLQLQASNARAQDAAQITPIEEGASQIEVITGWNAGAKRAAFNLVKDRLAEAQILWKETLITPGVSTYDHLQKLKRDIDRGKGPDFIRLTGQELPEAFAMGLLESSLDIVGRESNWTLATPGIVSNLSKPGPEREWVGFPVNIHATNRMYINKRLLESIGMEPPTDWGGLIDMLEAAKERGIIPLAHGGEAWQDLLLFENVLLSTSGSQLYKGLFEENEAEYASQDSLLRALNRLAQLRNFVDDQFPGRRWSLATSMIIRNDALVQVTGEWALGEFLNAGKKPNIDFICLPFPNTASHFLVSSDQLAAVRSPKNRHMIKQQAAEIMFSKGAQHDVSVVTGGISGRVDSLGSTPNTCQTDSIEVLASENSAIGSLSHKHAISSKTQKALFPLITRQFNQIRTKVKSRDTASAIKRIISQAK